MVLIDVDLTTKENPYCDCNQGCGETAEVLGKIQTQSSLVSEQKNLSVCELTSKIYCWSYPMRLLDVGALEALKVLDLETLGQFAPSRRL